MSLYPQPFRKHRVLWEHLTPSPLAPKVKPAAAALPTQAPPSQGCPSHLHTPHRPSTLCQKGHPCSCQATSAQARVFALGPQDGTDRKALLPPLAPDRRTQRRTDCRLLKPSHRLPTQLAFPPHLPSRYPPRYNRSAGSIRQVGNELRQHSWRQLIFSNKSLSFSALQFSLLPWIFQYFLNKCKYLEEVSSTKNKHDASYTGRIQLSVILTGPAQHLMKHLDTVNYSKIESSSWNMPELDLSGYSSEHSKIRLIPLKEKEKSPY